MDQKLLHMLGVGDGALCRGQGGQDFHVFLQKYLIFKIILG